LINAHEGAGLEKDRPKPFEGPKD